MQIKHISECCKPQTKAAFRGLESKDSGKQVRYKHYYEMSDDDLRAYSVVKAYNKTKNGTKSRLKNALPALTSIAIGTSLALTQPGKFSAKAKTGLGFLALTTLVDSIFNVVSKKVDNYYANKKSSNTSSKEEKQAVKFGSIALTAGAVAGTGLILSSGKNVFKGTKIADFITKESSTLAKELNLSKFGKFIEKHSNNFISKHGKLNSILSVFLPFGIVGASTAVNNKLIKSISKDINKLSLNNYIKGKAAQIDARSHFESVDAIEV